MPGQKTTTPFSMPPEIAARVSGRLTSIERGEGLEPFLCGWFTNADESPMGAVNGALILAFTTDDTVVMIRVGRDPINGYAVELPGGALALGEDPAEAIVRILLQKTGYRAQEVRPLGQIRQWNAFTDAGSYNFVAYGCQRVADPILTEFQQVHNLTVFECTLFDILDKMDSGDPEYHDPTVGDTILRYLRRSGHIGRSL